MSIASDAHSLACRLSFGGEPRGAVPQPVSCPAEAYSYDGAGAITLPNMGKDGDCVHDALGSATIPSIAYDAAADEITVTISGGGLDLKVKLSKAGLVEVPAKAQQLTPLES